jgi:hypothetical protein
VRVRGGDGSVFTLKRKAALNRFLGALLPDYFAQRFPAGSRLIFTSPISLNSPPI